MRMQRRGMTLVELLVVVTILGILLAVSVPMLRPMLDSRKTSSAAQILAGTFQQARMKSIQEGKSYGIRLVPYPSAPNTSVQLRLQKNASMWVNSYHRVVIDAGMIKLREHTSTEEYEAVRATFQPGYLVQFNRVGRWFEIGAQGTEPTVATLAAPYNNLTIPLHTLNPMPTHRGASEWEYRITAAPTPAWIPQRVMPHQTVVDLSFSGGEVLNFAGKEKAADEGEIPATFASGDDVIVMFSPLGQVDMLYINGKSQKVNEMLYFCVGEWDRQLDTEGKTMAEDGKSNLESPATYWVTLHAKTGEVRITENAPVKTANDKNQRLIEARKFAKEYFVNVGGF